MEASLDRFTPEPPSVVLLRGVRGRRAPLSPAPELVEEVTFFSSTDRGLMGLWLRP